MIELRGINMYFGKNHVLRDLSLSINEGEFMTLLGPSGCGKTTTLRIIAGLENPQSGTLHIDGKEIINAAEARFEPPKKRSLGMVFQSYALWPHMTVFQNAAFGLQNLKMPKAEIEGKVQDVLERLQILEYAGRYPSELSGGQQQRVAIARAIVTEPKILLLDEPLSNLDARLRTEMRSELKRLHSELGTTLIFVTHDQLEALTMSTRIAAFFDGEIVQVDTPVNVYKNPCNLQAADFIGSPGINFVDAEARSENSRLYVNSILGEMVFETSLRDEKNFQCTLAIRPEHLILTANQDFCEAKITTIMPAGSETLVYVCAGGTTLLYKTLEAADFQPEQKIWVTAQPGKVNIYDKKSGLLIKRVD